MYRNSILNINMTRNTYKLQYYRLDQVKETSASNEMYNNIGRNCEKQLPQVVDITTLVTDMKILCTVDQDVFHCQIFLTRYTDWRVIHPQPPSTYVLYTCRCDLIVVGREQAVENKRSLRRSLFYSDAHPNVGRTE